MKAREECVKWCFENQKTKKFRRLVLVLYWLMNLQNWKWFFVETLISFGPCTLKILVLVPIFLIASKFILDDKRVPHTNNV